MCVCMRGRVGQERKSNLQCIYLTSTTSARWSSSISTVRNHVNGIYLCYDVVRMAPYRCSLSCNFSLLSLPFPFFSFPDHFKSVPYSLYSCATEVTAVICFSVFFLHACKICIFALYTHNFKVTRMVLSYISYVFHVSPLIMIDSCFYGCCNLFYNTPESAFLYFSCSFLHWCTLKVPSNTQQVMLQWTPSTWILVEMHLLNFFWLSNRSGIFRYRQIGHMLYLLK